MATDGRDPRERIRSELESTRAQFHALLDSLSDRELAAKSNNRGWTNGEILFHMTFAMMILLSLINVLRVFGHLPKGCSRSFAGMLNGGTRLFNWINAAGARGGGRVYSGRRMADKYDAVHRSVLKRLASVRGNEWTHGMYYPIRWDALFDEYMTIEKLFLYPVVHFRFHLGQIRPPKREKQMARAPLPCYDLKRV